MAMSLCPTFWPTLYIPYTRLDGVFSGSRLEIYTLQKDHVMHDSHKREQRAP